jgi:hypothetical protein
MDYQLENLGPERFQQLVQALLVSEFPNVTCFPIGQPDGGRDAIQRLSPTAESAPLAVYQIKYARNPFNVDNIVKWLCDKADGEVNKIPALIAMGAARYILVTNVPGTGHLHTGSMDKVLQALANEFHIPVQCWWRDDINRRLDGQWNIKLRYPEIMSGHDFFRLFIETTAGQDQERRMNALRAFLSDQYDEDVDVKFKQVELHTKLLDLFIDLPFRLSFSADDADFASTASPVSMRGTWDEASKTVVMSNEQEDG